MSRTSNGNMTGRAAQTHLREFREYLEETRPSKMDKSHVMNVCKQIHLILGDDYSAWLDAQPENNDEFRTAAIAKLDALKKAEQERQAAESTKYDFTPTPSDMPNIDFDNINPIPF